VRWSDPLLGYSGLVRMLLHAGELSPFGALGGGIGGGTGGAFGSLVSVAMAGSLIGGSSTACAGSGWYWASQAV
jgi:hypothetical protein